MKRYLYLFFGIAFLLSCGGPAQKPTDLSGYVWPPPPNPPTIRLIKVIATDVDVTLKTTSSRLFGEEVTFAFKKPHGIAVDMAGNIIVTDSYTSDVHIINLQQGTIRSLFNPYGWKEPASVAVDNINGLIGITNSNRVAILDQKSSKLKITIGNRESLQRPVGIAFDPSRKIIYIADIRKHEIHSYDYSGKHIAQIAGRGNQPGEVYYPSSLALDSKGRLYVIDSMNWRVQIFNPDGTIYKVFGEHGDAPGMFARPKYIAISRDDYIFVTDAAFDNFQIFKPDTSVFGFVGSPGGRYGSFHQPQGIFVDKDDKVYVADQTNRRIQIFQYLSDTYLKEHPEEAK